MSTSPAVLRPPTKASAMPIPREDRIEEAPQGAPARPPARIKSASCPDCSIETMPSGEGVAKVVIPAEVMRRLKTRSQGLSFDEYVWGIIKRALYAETFG